MTLASAAKRTAVIVASMLVFRARLRRPDGGAVSGWSKPDKIVVS